MIEIMANHDDKILFYLIFIIWLLSEIIGGWIIPHYRRHGSKVKGISNNDQLLTRIGVIISILMVYLMAKNSLNSLPGIFNLPDWTYLLGLIMMISGIIIRQWSIAVLGQYFSPNLGVQKDQKVVNKGPYHLIRHPSYTGMLFIILGVSVAWQSLIALIISTMLIGVTISYRIHVEEKMLIAELREEYINYKKHTKKLIPYII